MLPTLAPRDVIALTVILAYLIFSYFTGSNMVPSALMLVVGYYFARKDELNAPPPNNGE